MEKNNNKTQTPTLKINSEDKYTLSDVWSSIPFFTRTLFIITLIIYVLDKLVLDDSLSFDLSNVTYMSIHQIELWRLITSNFMTTTLIKIFLGFAIWSKYATTVELSIGTIKYGLLFFINSLFIQLLYCIIIIIVALIKRNERYLLNKLNRRYIENSGFWGFAMYEITLFCLSNPDLRITLLLIPLTVKTKIYPYFFVVLFFIINKFKVDWEIISGIIYGFLYHRFSLNKYLQISDSFVLKLENSCCFKWMIKNSSFISVNKIYSEVSTTTGDEKSNKYEEKDNFSNNDQETELGKLKVVKVEDSSDTNERENNEIGKN